MKLNQVAFYATVLLLSVTFLFVGNHLAGDGVTVPADDGSEIVSARITEIINRTEDVLGGGLDGEVVQTSTRFLAQVTSGELRGTTLTAEQSVSTVFGTEQRMVDVGDHVLLWSSEWIETYFFIDYVRSNHLITLGAVLAVFIMLFGGYKGISALVALGLACLSIFFVFVPAILSGRNIYLATAVICVYAILSTLLLVAGPQKKTLAAILGCLGGVIIAGGLMLFLDTALYLTGFLGGEAEGLLRLPTEVPIDLRAIVFAGVIIGALGAIMDVSVSMSSSLWEVRLASKRVSTKDLFRSGVNIGRDILGTMLNTLILAYIGSSLSLLLLIIAYATSMVELFNREMIVVEILRAIVGGFGMLLTIPLTAGICGWLYTKAGKSTNLMKQTLRTKGK